MAKRTVRDADRAPLGSPKTFRIGRRRYAVGLFWQVADSSKTIRREARGVAQETGINADRKSVV